MVLFWFFRYLGDLSGGQILKTMAVKSYELPENGDGVRFYEFKNIPDLVEFKNAYRTKLDSLEVDRETADNLVEEAKVAFSLNIGLFKELDSLAGFEEEIIHEEVETIQGMRQQTKAPGRQKDTGEVEHVTKKNEFDWLKAIAAIIVAVAVLIAVALNLVGKQM